jgi:outer membrane protein OmpA-like peptidoglycan-associated protein
MPSQLLESLRSLVTPEVEAGLAARLGAPGGVARRGLDAAYGSILAGLVALLPDSGSMRQVFELVADEPGGTAATGEALLSAAFGNRMDAVGEATGRASGLRPDAARALLAAAAPMVVAVLRRRVAEGGLDANGLTALLASQKDRILDDAPAGMGSLLGVSDIPRVAAAAVGVRPPAPAPRKPPRGSRWLWPATAGAALVALLLLLARDSEVEPVSTTLGDDAVGAMSEAAATAAVAASNLGGLVRRRLGDGTELEVPERGIEARVIAFLDDPNRPADRTTWFDFDRLAFAEGSDAIRAESQEQLENIAAILQAYPAARIKIGGYTDSTGDRRANERLSQRRADAVRDALIARGVERDRIEAEGYGEQFPVADNATEEGRARNRRIALRVTEK